METPVRWMVAILSRVARTSFSQAPVMTEILVRSTIPVSTAVVPRDLQLLVTMPIPARMTVAEKTACVYMFPELAPAMTGICVHSVTIATKENVSQVV